MKTSGKKTAPLGHHVTRQDRQERAQALLRIRAERSVTEQLEIIKTRRGKSKKERARLQGPERKTA